MFNYYNRFMKKILLKIPKYILVPLTGVAPARPNGQGILSASCLLIPT